MSEVPKFRLESKDGQSFEVIQGRSALYRHLGERALYDNVFLLSEEATPENRIGRPIFITGFLTPEQITQVTLFMLNNGYETHLNLGEVNPEFARVREEMLSEEVGDLDDFQIPTEWADERTD